MDELSHDELRHLLPAAALDVLEPHEQALMRSHLSGCTDCTRLHSEYREVIGRVAGSFEPPDSMPADRVSRTRERLLARVAAERGTADIAPPAPAPSAGGRFPALASRWAGWAVAAGLASILFFHHGIHRPIGEGWIVAGILTVATTVLAIHAFVQQRRVAALRTELEHRTKPAVSPQPPVSPQT
jgi:anti-sigma factor RsiW